MLPRSMLVGAYPSSIEAGFAQGLLKQQGIASEVDGLTSQSWLAGAVPLMGFRLFVAREDVERARQVLGEPVVTTESDEDPALTASSLARRHAAIPGAAGLLGLLIRGPLTLAAAGVVAVTLLRSPAGQTMTRRARVLLGILAGVVALASAAMLAIGWPLEMFDGVPDFSLWGWIGIDVALAVAVVLASRPALDRGV